MRRLRAETSVTAKKFASQARIAPSALEAQQLFSDGVAALQDIYDNSVSVRVCECMIE